MDGLAITLIYKNGILIQAATRGDGKVGEDVTQNIKTIEAIPLRLLIEKLPMSVQEKVKGEVEVRGEVYMGKKEFDKLNKEQEKSEALIFSRTILEVLLRVLSKT